VLWSRQGKDIDFRKFHKPAANMILYNTVVLILGMAVLFILACMNMAGQIPAEWIKERVQVVTVKGEIHPTFGRLKVGDEIWHFSSPPASWEHLCGRAGIVLVRKGRIIRSKVLMLN
jgi:hypothetical protein